jgi:hypothetical protein
VGHTVPRVAPRLGLRLGRRVAFVLTLALASASATVVCSCRGPARPAGNAEPAPEPVAASDVVVLARRDGSELEPGAARAFGLLMPAGAVERFVGDASRIYYVQAPMARVMRYLQRRLVITTAEIHPLGALVRNAQVRVAPGAQPLFVDVGVRDEGDRTMITVWNRTALPVPTRSLEEGMRAAGVDPQSGRPLPENNH